MILWKLLGIIFVIVGFVLWLMPILPGMPLMIWGAYLLLGKERSYRYFNKIKELLEPILKRFRK